MASCGDVVAASGGDSADITKVVARKLQSQADPSEVKDAEATVSKISFRMVGREFSYFKLTTGLKASRFDGLVDWFCEKYGLGDYHKQNMMDGKSSKLNVNSIETFCFTANEVGSVVSGAFVSRKVTEASTDHEATFDVACAVYTTKLKVTQRSLTHLQQEHLKIHFIGRARTALIAKYPALK